MPARLRRKQQDRLSRAHGALIFFWTDNKHGNHGRRRISCDNFILRWLPHRRFSFEGAAMHKITTATLVMSAVLVCGGPAGAQGVLPFAVEVRGGGAMPTGDWNEDETIENGLGFGANIQVAVAPMVSIYGGWERYSFPIETEEDPDFEGVEADATDTGFRLGGQVTLPLSGLAGVSPFAFGGLTYGKTEVGLGDGSSSISFKSDGAVGFEVGGGVAISVAPMLSLTPALRYRSHSAEFDAFQELGGEETTVSYLSLDVGLKLGI